MVLSLYKSVKLRGSHVPILAGRGYGVSIECMRFQLDRQALTVEYAVHPDDDTTQSSVQNLDASQGTPPPNSVSRVSLPCL